MALLVTQHYRVAGGVKLHTTIMISPMGNGTIIVSILLCYGNIEITISTFNLGVALPTYVSHISSRGFEPCSLVLFNSNIKFSSRTGINLSKLDYGVNIVSCVLVTHLSILSIPN